MSQQRARTVTALRSQLEASLLKGSIVATVGVAGAGVLIGLLSRSMSIVFDGLFSSIDAVVGVVTLVVARLLASEGSHRFQYGYWHLEPLVLALNASVLVLLCGYAFLNAVQGLLTGGHALRFDMGIVYAAIVAVICFGMAFRLRRVNERLESELIALEVHSWLMSALITLALLIAFAGALAIKGTRLEYLTPYVDPAVLAVLAPVLLPVPLRTARQAFAEIFLITSKEMDADVKAAAEAAAARHGFLDFKSYAVEVGRARFIEISFLVPADMPVASITDFDAIRHEIGQALGGTGPEQWLTIVFTADPDLV
ncbi:cation diffusion facilitator family transporter [Polymorphobacter fuscus]|uniref:Cation transporter n=1 Tax=Sandarakinorhabdus fusca TaxID=1439888 RepID=A0A7C9KJR1_9SPHN|nr:cation transporter [Polymorphobacter fuscus]KAB7644970.1 cation transporter [Polymorphobacter fuscus]MQT18259.1 cation transporter [Polymorphobacter fuscus]NJC09583.1 putative Co/Zn/Cd cation transporter (cation efflux family) [Polymorphobacter fuscus]